MLLLRSQSSERGRSPQVVWTYEIMSDCAVKEKVSPLVVSKSPMYDILLFPAIVIPASSMSGLAYVVNLAIPDTDVTWKQLKRWHDYCAAAVIV